MSDEKNVGLEAERLEDVKAPADFSSHVEHKEGTNEALTGLTDEEHIIAAAMRRKVDILIMPTVMVVYLLNWIDR